MNSRTMRIMEMVKILCDNDPSQNMEKQNSVQYVEGMPLFPFESQNFFMMVDQNTVEILKTTFMAIEKEEQCDAENSKSSSSLDQVNESKEQLLVDNGRVEHCLSKQHLDGENSKSFGSLAQVNVGNEQLLEDEKSRSSSSSSSNSSSPRKFISTDDDTDADPDFSFSGDDEHSSSEGEANEDVLTEKKKKRKRRANPSEWKSNIAKKRKNLGKRYKSKTTKKTVSAKEMRPGCGEKCIYKCSSKIPEDQRFKIFQKYYGFGDLNMQRDFISRHIKDIPQPVHSKNRNRIGNVAYYFPMNGNNIRVCKHFFCATLSISSTTVSTVRKKVVDGVLEGDNRGKHGNHRKLSSSITDDMRAHIDSIPRIPSHYLRAQTEREYIEGDRTIAQIYRDYVSNCKKNGKSFGSRTVFFEIFDQYNISFHIPKKDQCELCTAYENSDKQEKIQEYRQHLQEKDEARKEKNEDKIDPDTSKFVCTYDLQAALSTPRGEVSVFYYKSKLSTYNLTIYDLKSHECVCNVWHEGEGRRGAVEIATAVFKFIEQKAKATSKMISFVFYTDNCSGQQKNKYMVMMYMYCLCLFPNITTIEHKFLIKGHTQNEGDSAHSVIEKEIKRTLKAGCIYVPSQYFQLMRTAKKTPPFYTVNELSHEDFIDFKALEIEQNFKTNEKNETVPFTDIKIIKLKQENPFAFLYKTSYLAENFNVVDAYLNKRKTKTRASATITLDERIEKIKNWTVKKAYNAPIPIALNKKQDLMFLVNNNYIKKTYFDFYNNLCT